MTAIKTTRRINTKGPLSSSPAAGAIPHESPSDIVRQSLATLWAHKFAHSYHVWNRLGRGSLLLLVGLGEGFRSGRKKNWPILVKTSCYLPGRIPAVEGSLVSGRPYFFTYGDYLAIKDEAKSLRTISPVLNREDIRAVSEFGSTNGQVFGVAPVYNKIRTVPVAPDAGSTTKTAPNAGESPYGLGAFKEYFSRTSGGRFIHPAQRISFDIIASWPKWTGREQRHQRAHLYSHRDHADVVPAES